MSDVLSQVEFATIVECWVKGSRFYESMLLHDAALRTNLKTAEAALGAATEHMGELQAKRAECDRLEERISMATARAGAAESALAAERVRAENLYLTAEAETTRAERLTAVIEQEAAGQEDAAKRFRRSRLNGTLDMDPENIATATAVRLRKALEKE